MHPKNRIVLILFLCTVNIQSIDRGESTYIQFGTHGFSGPTESHFNKEKKIIYKECTFFDRSLELWTFKPSENKKRTKHFYKCKLKTTYFSKTYFFFFFWSDGTIHRFTKGVQQIRTTLTIGRHYTVTPHTPAGHGMRTPIRSGRKSTPRFTSPLKRMVWEWKLFGFCCHPREHSRRKKACIYESWALSLIFENFLIPDLSFRLFSSDVFILANVCQCSKKNCTWNKGGGETCYTGNSLETSRREKRKRS